MLEICSTPYKESPETTHVLWGSIEGILDQPLPKKNAIVANHYNDFKSQYAHELSQHTEDICIWTGGIDVEGTTHTVHVMPIKHLLIEQVNTDKIYKLLGSLDKHIAATDVPTGIMFPVFLPLSETAMFNLCKEIGNILHASTLPFKGYTLG
jgi:hypothetical protein